MTKEKQTSLTRYANELKEKLKSPAPVKHANNVPTYHEFLTNELRKVTATLEAAKLDGAK